MLQKKHCSVTNKCYRTNRKQNNNKNSQVSLLSMKTSAYSTWVRRSHLRSRRWSHRHWWWGRRPGAHTGTGSCCTLRAAHLTQHVICQHHSTFQFNAPTPKKPKQTPNYLFALLHVLCSEMITLDCIGISPHNLQHSSVLENSEFWGIAHLCRCPLKEPQMRCKFSYYLFWLTQSWNLTKVSCHKVLHIAQSNLKFFT